MADSTLLKILKKYKVETPISQYLGGCADAAGTVGDGQFYAVDLTSVNLGTRIYNFDKKSIYDAAQIIFEDVIISKGYDLTPIEKIEFYSSKAIQLGKKTVTNAHGTFYINKEFFDLNLEDALVENSLEEKIDKLDKGFKVNLSKIAEQIGNIFKRR